MNELDAFEQQLKKSLEQYEVPYNSADWAQMERALSSGVRGWGRGRALLTGLLVAGGLLIGGTAYFMGRDTDKPIADSAGANGQTDATFTDLSNTSTVPSHESGPAQLPAEAIVEQPIDTRKPHLSELVAAQEQHSGITDRSTPSSTTTSKAAVTNASAAPGPGPSAPKSAGTAFRASVKEACPGSPVEFTVEHMPEDGIYLWNFGDGSFSNKPNPQHVFSKPGSYQVMLSMSSAGAGTIHNKPSSDMIVIHDAPSAAFNILKMDYAGQVPTVHFESRAQGAKTYQWDLGDGSVSTMAHPDHVYKQKGVYQVVQTVTNETGCVDRKVKELRIDRDFDLGAPKSFSPDGDGKEDNFMPQALLDLKVKFQLAVYDPAGTLVYNTSDATRPWCGKVRNQGAVCAPGDYVWVVDVEAANRATETFTGTVKLLP